MGYVEQNLASGEVVHYRTRLHWIVLVAPMVLGCFLAFPGLFFLLGAFSTRELALGWIGLFFLLAAAVSVGLGLWHRASTEMAVTNRRVIIKTGMVSRKTLELLLPKVESVAVDQGLLGRMLAYGTIIVRGTGGTTEPFPKVAHPLEFRRQVQEQIEGSQGQARAAIPTP